MRTLVLVASLVILVSFTFVVVALLGALVLGSLWAMTRKHDPR